MRPGLSSVVHLRFVPAYSATHMGQEHATSSQDGGHRTGTGQDRTARLQTAGPCTTGRQVGVHCTCPSVSLYIWCFCAKQSISFVAFPRAQYCLLRCCSSPLHEKETKRKQALRLTLYRQTRRLIPCLFAVPTFESWLLIVLNARKDGQAIVSASRR